MSAHPTRPLLAFGLYAGLFAALAMPLAVAFLWSLVVPKAGWFAPDIVPPSLSLDTWSTMLAGRGLIRGIGVSLVISVLVTLLTTLLALPTAYALAKLPVPGKRAIELFVLAPLIVPGLIVGVGLGLVFIRLGLAYSIIGVVLVQTIGTLPFMIRVLAAAIEAIPDDLVHAARSLGAGPLDVARRLIVPLAWPGFVAGGLLSFVSSFEEFEKTFIVGAPHIQTLTTMLWTYLGGRLIIFPNAAVVTFVLIVPAILVFFLAQAALRDERALAAGMGKL
ncbi:MAG: ABC transporter permease subunit [Hyphomicrobiaceae bacterium]|nr:ABC transporter permease subunit [Hyphomicrobiaceae bacterium]